MDDTPAKENSEKEFNKIDLSQLQGFSFGTQWTQDKPGSSDRRERTDRPRREGGPAERRDRRAFRRPAGADAGPEAGYAGGGVGVAAEPRERGDYAGDRGPRREFRGPRR
ncbi:MAG TPA: hypothetical protein VHE13_08150, partial [Opitutus sp.]|nr:hypothetical protein [Opitutus sp.]